MTTIQRDYLRRVRFSPYRKGMGPTFTLITWDTHRSVGGKSRLGYRLTMRDQRKLVELFTGEDFGCSPLHCVDSDETVKAIMSFLTLRPGDTDPEYFASYTPEQLEYCSHHAESLAGAVYSRLGE